MTAVKHRCVLGLHCNAPFPLHLTDATYSYIQATMDDSDDDDAVDDDDDMTMDVVPEGCRALANEPLGRS